MAPDAPPFDTSDTTCQARENIPQSPSHYSWHHFKETAFNLENELQV